MAWIVTMFSMVAVQDKDVFKRQPTRYEESICCPFWICAVASYGGWTQFWQFVSVCHLPNHGKRKVAAHKLKLDKWNICWWKFLIDRYKFDVFVVFMATWTIEYNLKISFFLSLHKIRSLDFPINLHTAYYNYSLSFETYLTKILTDGYLDNQLYIIVM